MERRRGPRRVTAVAAALVIALAPVIPAEASPSPDYPSWEEVEAAQHDAAAAARQAARLEALLADLEAEGVRLGREAQLRAEESFIAQQELEDASARADALARSVAAAEQRASDSAGRAANAIVQLSRTGGGDPSLALLAADHGEADEILDALASAARMGETAQALLEAAIADRNTANALAAQADTARGLRAQAAAAAEQSAARATEAVAAAAASAAAHAADLDRMYEQLATLRGTSAELERAYREGRESEEETSSPEAPADPGPDPGPEAPDPGGGPDPDEAPAPHPDAPPPSTPTTVSSKVSGAISYAKAQLGEPYVYAGAGPNGWDCSGLTMKSYASVGVAIGGHGSTSQYNAMKSAGRLVPVAKRLPGDLLFYSDGGSTSGTKYHVALYIGDGRMIEAPYPGQVVRITSVRTLDLVPYAGRPTG